MVKLQDSTTLLISWQPPFTHDDFPIHMYTLTIRDASSIIHTQVYSNVGTSDFEHYYTRDGVPTECSNITLEVTATSAVGTSDPGSVIYTFPIGK